MKKTKLITSLCLLVLTFACLTFGVYSAVKTSFTASGTITFNAYECDVTIDGTIEGAIQKEGGATIQTTYKGASKSGHDGYTAGANGAIPTWTMGDMAFDELNEADYNNYFDIRIIVSNYSAYPIKVSLTKTEVPSGITTEEKTHYGDPFELAAMSNNSPISDGYCIRIKVSGNTPINNGAVSIALTIEPKV